MRYTFQEPPEKFQGKVWFGHEIHLQLADSARREQCWELVERIAGSKGKGWRLRDPDRTLRLELSRSIRHREEYVIRFTSKIHAAQFKLLWEETEEDDADFQFRATMAALNGLTATFKLNFAIPRAVGHCNPLRGPSVIIWDEDWFNNMYPHDIKPFVAAPITRMNSLKNQGHTVMNTEELEKRLRDGI